MSIRANGNTGKHKMKINKTDLGFEVESSMVGLLQFRRNEGDTWQFDIFDNSSKVASAKCVGMRLSAVTVDGRPMFETTGQDVVAMSDEIRCLLIANAVAVYNEK